MTYSFSPNISQRGRTEDFVKRQIILQTEVFKKKTAKIFLTDEEKQKSSNKLLEELANVIQNTPVSVNRKDQTTKEDCQ